MVWDDGTGVPRIKKFLTNRKQVLTPETMLFADKVRTNDSAMRELVLLFDGMTVFETPKPSSLISHLIRVRNNPHDGVYLDFFPGTTTTGSFRSFDSISALSAIRSAIPCIDKQQITFGYISKAILSVGGSGP